MVTHWIKNLCGAVVIASVCLACQKRTGGGGWDPPTDTGQGPVGGNPPIGPNPPVTPTPEYSLFVSVDNLKGSLVIRNNKDAQLLTMQASGTFAFANKIKENSDYELEIVQQPQEAFQKCSIQTNTGTVVKDMPAVKVTCIDSYLIGLKLALPQNTALKSELSLTLNNVDTLRLNATSVPDAQGVYYFSTRVLSGQDYDVKIATQPTELKCSVLRNQGRVANAPITDIGVSCFGDLVPAYDNALRFNAYVKRNNPEQSCTGDEQGFLSATCVQGGLFRRFEIPLASCQDYREVKDALGLFDWTCRNQNNAAVFQSTGLKNDKKMLDLIDVDQVAFKPNHIVVTTLANQVTQTKDLVWWPETKVEQVLDGGEITVAHRVYVFKTPQTKHLIVKPAVSNIALLFTKDASLKANVADLIASKAVVSLTNNRFVYAEGLFIDSDKQCISGLSLDGVNLSTFKDVVIKKVKNTPACLANGLDATAVSVSNRSSFNLFKNMRLLENESYGLRLRDSRQNTFSYFVASGNPNFFNKEGAIDTCDTEEDLELVKRAHASVFMDAYSHNNVFDVAKIANNRIAIINLAAGTVFNRLTATANGEGLEFLFKKKGKADTFVKRTRYFDSLKLDGRDVRGGGISSVSVLNTTIAQDQNNGIKMEHVLNSTFNNVVLANNQGIGAHFNWAEIDLNPAKIKIDIKSMFAALNKRYDLGVSARLKDTLRYSDDNTCGRSEQCVFIKDTQDASMAGINCRQINPITQFKALPFLRGLDDTQDQTNKNALALDIKNEFVGQLTDDFSVDFELDTSASGSMYQMGPKNKINNSVFEPVQNFFKTTDDLSAINTCEEDQTFGLDANDKSFAGHCLDSSVQCINWNYALSLQSKYLKAKHESIPQQEFFMNHLWSAQTTQSDANQSCAHVLGAAPIQEVDLNVQRKIEIGRDMTRDAICSVELSNMTFNSCKTVALANAYEILEDGIGNDNLLCESGEACVFAPNLGSYQGEGRLVLKEAHVSRTQGNVKLENIDLYVYEKNGQ